MTFVELMSKADEQQRSKMVAMIVSDGITIIAYNSWIKGRRTPMPFYQNQLRRYVKRIFELDLTTKELFPKS
ncbi:MAG: hypothetical protein K5651_01845 [Bacteroidales bacterium]|nr:hypothetical protein [Bacteroidales bacterium]